MLSSKVKFSADRQTDRQIPVKQHVPDVSMRGHKKLQLLGQLFAMQKKRSAHAKSVCCH